MQILNDWLDILDFKILSSMFASSHKVFPIPKPSIAFLENVLWWKFCVLRKVHTDFGLRVSHNSIHKHNSNFSSSSYPACIYEKNRFDQNTPYIRKVWMTGLIFSISRSCHLCLHLPTKFFQFQNPPFHSLKMCFDGNFVF